MSNTRKARGTSMLNNNLNWSVETAAKPLPVLGVWPLQTAPPVVWADAAGRHDVRDLARAHREAPEGAVQTQWCARLAPGSAMRLLLLIRFTNPVRCEFSLMFQPGHHGALLNAVAAGAVTIVTREPQLRDGVVTARQGLAVEIDRKGLQDALDGTPHL